MRDHTLTSEVVETVLKDCLTNEQDGAFISTPIARSYVLDRKRLETYRDEIYDWIGQLPIEFLADGGGGWSFLNLCNLTDGTQWTGLHLRMEQLVALAEGLGLAQFQLPRELWSVLPGGVPYIVFRQEVTP